VKAKSHGRSERHFIVGAGCGERASPSRPSDKCDSMRVKRLKWLEGVAWDKGRGILIFRINAELDISAK
jgi:hypothetical protein